MRLNDFIILLRDIMSIVLSGNLTVLLKKKKEYSLKYFSYFK